MTLNDAPAVTARRWLGAAADDSAAEMRHQNESSVAAVTDIKSALFTTVVIEIATVGAILAGVASIGLAALHSWLAWDNLAPDAKGRLLVLSVVMFLVALRSAFVNEPTRALVFATLKPGSCALVGNGHVVVYEVSILVFVYLNLSILYKNIGQEAVLDDARNAAAAATARRPKPKAAAKRGRPRNVSRSPSSRHDPPPAMDSSHMASSESNSGQYSATATGTGTATAAGAGTATGSPPRLQGGGDPGLEEDEGTDPSSLEVYHLWLGPVGLFFIVIDSAVKPFSVQPWAGTVSQVLVGALAAAIVICTTAAWFNARHFLKRPIAGVCLRAVGCCVQESCSCRAAHGARAEEEEEEPFGPFKAHGPGLTDPASSLARPPSAPAGIAARSRQWRCSWPAWWPFNARGATTILSTVVFPAVVLSPYVVDVFWPHSCPEWLASGGGGMAAASNPPPPGSVWPQGLDATSENDRSIVLASLVKIMAMVLASAAIAVILSGSIILDGQHELAARRRDAAKESADTLRRAIGYISHEARGPLNAAVLSLTLLEDAEDFEEEDAAAGGDASMPLAGGGLSSDRLLSDLATSIHASKRHLDDLLLWERAGSEEDTASGSNWAWNDPELTLMSYAERAFRGSCDAEDIDFEVVPLLQLARPPRKARSTDRAPFVAVDSLAAETAIAGLISSENTTDGGVHHAATDAPLVSGSRGPDAGVGATPAVRGLELFMDADRLLGVCTNAVSNCVKHTPGGGSGRIQVVCTVLTGKAAAATALGAPAQTPQDVQARLDAAPGRGGCRGSMPSSRRVPDTSEQGSARQSQPEGSRASSAKPAAGRAASLTELAGAAGAGRAPGTVEKASLFSPPEHAVLQLEVRDNGNGISKELLESGKLFQPFARLRQGDDSLRMASSGLGLAIVRSIVVDRMHGRVGLSSREGKGTVFFARVPLWVRMPLATEMASLSAPKEAQPVTAVSQTSASTLPVAPPIVVGDPPFTPLPTSHAMRVTRGSKPVTGAAGEDAEAEDAEAEDAEAEDAEAEDAKAGDQKARDSAGDSVAATAGVDGGRSRADRAARREQRLADRKARAGAASAGAAVPGSAVVTTPKANNSAKEDSRARRAARAKKSNRRQEPRAKPLSALRAMSAAWKGKLAFVVDDERVNRTLLAALLRRWGFVVREFEDGAEAVAALLRATTSLTGAALSASLRDGAGSDAARASALEQGDAAEVSAKPGSADRAAPPAPAAGPASSTGRSTARSSAGSPAGNVGATIAGFGDQATTLMASAAASGSALVADGIPDIMTLDVEMPRLDGFGVLRKRLVMVDNYVSTGDTGVAAQLAKMPVIVVSGNARQSDKDRLHKYGAHRILTKPVDPDLLAKSIQQALEADGGPTA